MGNFTYWNCICECGKELEINYRDLLSEKILCCENCKSPEKTVLDAANSDVYYNTTAGFRGVNYVKKTNKWRSILIFKGVRYELGHYHSIDDAIQARLLAEEMINEFIDDFYKNVKPQLELKNHNILL